jgi:hypothetical protein
MKIMQIEVYQYSDLSEKAKTNVIHWLDEWPLEYENEDGSMSYQYFYEADESDIEDHCDCNGYLFDINGKPIHHLVKEVA